MVFIKQAPVIQTALKSMFHHDAADWSHFPRILQSDDPASQRDTNLKRATSNAFSLSSFCTLPVPAPSGRSHGSSYQSSAVIVANRPQE